MVQLQEFSTKINQSTYEGSALWSVILDDGTTIYEPSCWLKLKKYCEQEGFFIKKLKVSFRDNAYVAPPAEKYFVIKSIIGGMGAKNSHFYLIGRLDSGILTVDKVSSPCIRVLEQEVRDIERYKKCLIQSSNTLEK